MKLPEKEIELADLEDDFDRFPLPLSFDSHEEQRLFWRRHQILERICNRFNQMVKKLNLKH